MIELKIVQVCIHVSRPQGKLELVLHGASWSQHVDSTSSQHCALHLHDLSLTINPLTSWPVSTRTLTNPKQNILLSSTSRAMFIRGHFIRGHSKTLGDCPETKTDCTSGVPVGGRKGNKQVLGVGAEASRVTWSSCV